MHPLVISLTGTVDSSNFDEWKRDLLFEIQSTNYELLSDEDFVNATQRVKLFKSAEVTLKQAKQAAISQAKAINRLFSAIDEISEEARQARLSLERQVKTRKLEIKNQQIQSGIDRIQAFIDTQASELATLDCATHLDRGRFESAIRGKSGIKGVETAVRHLCADIEQEIIDRVANLRRNKTRLDALSAAHKLLFQDSNTLTDLPGTQFDLEIDKRIATYNADNTRRQSEQLKQALEDAENAELNPEQQDPACTAPAPQERYLITLNLLCTRDHAKELARVVKARFSDDPAVATIKLTRRHHDHAY